MRKKHPPILKERKVGRINKISPFQRTWKVEKNKIKISHVPQENVVGRGKKFKMKERLQNQKQLSFPKDVGRSKIEN